MFLQLVAYAGIATGFVLATLAISCGLYYLSEMVEEHSEVARRLLGRTIAGVTLTLLLLWLVDGFPFWLTLFLVVSQYIYYQNLKRFPFLAPLDPLFIALCVLAILNHYAWFRHFSNPHIPTLAERLASGYRDPVVPSFAQVALFFGFCVWLVPFALFVSLSAGDNVLPSTGEVGSERRQEGFAKVMVGRVREWIDRFLG